MIKEIKINELSDNFVKLIEKNWFLLGVVDKDGRKNAMTVSWGTVGRLWNKDVVSVFVRPTRHSYDLCENADIFTLSMWEAGEKRDMLGFMGKESGRDYDKFEKCGLKTAVKDGALLIAGAKMTIVLKKLYHHDFDPSKFLDESIDKHYDNDYHREYVCEILGVYLDD